jgi:hypothetical protein
MPSLTEPNQTGKREDLADIYAIVDTKSTPFVSRVNKSKKPTNSKFEWIIDEYADPVNSGVVDGQDVASYENHAENRARIGNYAQEWRRTAKVSRRSEEISTVAGVKSEIALATRKKLVEIKRDTESTLLAGNDGQADTGAAPYLTIGLDKWIDTTGPTAPASVPAAYRPASAQIETTAAASLTEKHVQDVLASIFDNTGMVGSYVLFAGSVLRRAFTDFTRTNIVATGMGAAGLRSRVYNFDGSSKTVTNSTSVFEGDYGTVEIVSSNFIGGTTVDTDRGYLLDMDKIHLRSEQRPTVERFADQGGGPRVLVSFIGGLQVDNPIGLGKFKP